MVLPLIWIVSATLAATAVVAGGTYEMGKDEGKREGEEKGAAERAVKTKRMERKIRRKEKIIKKTKKSVEEATVVAAKYYNEHQKFEQFTICIIAIGAAMAACDGDVHENEVRELRERTLGIAEINLPSSIERKIEQLLDQPPTFEQAMLYVEKLDHAVWPVIDSILAAVSIADGQVLETEKVFLNQWENYKTVQMAQSIQLRDGYRRQISFPNAVQLQ